MGQMAATAGGVAIGSVAGHAISNVSLTTLLLELNNPPRPCLAVAALVRELHNRAPLRNKVATISQLVAPMANKPPKSSHARAKWPISFSAR